MSRAASNPVVLHRFPPSIRSSKLLHSIPRKPFRFQSRNRHFPTLFCCQTNPKPVDSSTKVSSFAFFFCCFDGFFFVFFLWIEVLNAVCLCTWIMDRKGYVIFKTPCTYLCYLIDWKCAISLVIGF